MAKADSPDILYLIDGHAEIFRAYYAIRSGMNSPVTGEPTNATFGFTGMLIKLLDQFAPRYVVMAIDSPGKTFRDQIYEDYKGNRESPPDDFVPQVTRILEICRLFGIPVLAREGAEADDIIATVTQHTLDDPACSGLQIRIVSRDKDLEQLLGERVTMFDIHTDTTTDVATLKQTKGITPEQVAEVLALAGDSVDNVPGIEGIGPKTAAKLIGQFGTIDGILANLDRIKGNRRDNIEKGAAFLPTAQKLVTLDRQVQVDFSLEDAKVGGIDAASLQRAFRHLGFNRHQSDLDRLLDKAGGDAIAAHLFDAGPDPSGSVRPLSTAADQAYTAITTRKQLDQLATTLRKQKLVSVDTETIGLGHSAKLCGLSFAWEPGQAVYVPIRSPQPESHLDGQTVLTTLRPVLEEPGIGKCGHNLKYDLLVLQHAGVRMCGIVFDSMIGAFLAGTTGYGLDNLALSELGHETIPISRLIGPREAGRAQKTMDEVELEQITPYAAEDADIALRLCERLRPKLEAMGLTKLADEVEMPLVEVLALMEHDGIRVDPTVLDEQKQALQQRISGLRQRIIDAAGIPFNIDSPRQLADVLFNRLNLPVVKRTKTGPSTDIEVLEKLCEMDQVDESARTMVTLVVEYRQFAKLVGTYLKNLKQSIDPVTGRIHASFHQTGAATGRLSSSGPNLQNIPIRTDVGRQIRKAFIADPGPPPRTLLSADYSQIELRILAHLSDDAALVEAFANDLDIHTTVAAQVFAVHPDEVSNEQRSHAKTINFGIIYGVTPFGLARRIEGLDVHAARKLIAEYRKRFSGIDTFLARCVDHAKQHGYVKTMLGRRRAIPQTRSSNAGNRALVERLAINTVVQGSAADLIKLAMVNLHRRIVQEKLPMKLLVQIHDELVLEAPKQSADRCGAVVKQEMEQAIKLKVPLKVEVGVGNDWYSAK